MKFLFFKWIALPRIQGTTKKIYLGAYDSCEDAQRTIENWIKQNKVSQNHVSFFGLFLKVVVLVQNFQEKQLKSQTFSPQTTDEFDKKIKKEN